MIYTVGYQRMAGPQELAGLAKHFDAEVWDCRSNPVTRKAGFGPKQLHALLGPYGYRGTPWLGGRRTGAGPLEMPPADDLAFHRGIGNLALRGPLGGRYAGHENVILMCMEEAPAECHRHHTIAMALASKWVEVTHIFQRELILASELQRSLIADDEYDCETF